MAPRNLTQRVEIEAVDRDDIENAYAIGAHACRSCLQVHIDLADAAGAIFATVSLDFDQWQEVSDRVAHSIEEMLR